MCDDNDTEYQLVDMTSAAAESMCSFFVVFPAGPPGTNSSDGHRYARKGAAPDERDPWVQTMCPERSEDVERFTTEASAKAWIGARKLARSGRSHCRCRSAKGPVR